MGANQTKTIGGIAKKRNHPNQAAVWDDLLLSVGFKRNLVNGILLPLKNKEEGRGKIDLAFPDPRVYSLILFGPPGIGKTVIATAMANYLGWHYCYITPEDFTFKDKLDINRAFRFILNNSGKIWKHLEYTVLIFDEIEEVVGHRGKEGTDIARRLATTNMLTKFEQLRKDAENREILIVVCTNHLENLDPAFIRRGRFDWLVPVTTPDRRARYQMFSIAMEEEPKVMLHHDPEKHKVGLHSLSRISQGLTYAEIVELCKNAKVQFGKEASLREFERAVLKLTEKPAINRKDLELVEEESRTFARGHPFEYQTNLNNAIDNEFGRILVYAELEEAPVGPGRDCAIYIKVVNLTDFELENVEMIYRSEDLDPNYKGKGRESLYGKTIFNNIETCYGRISFKENKIQPNDDRDYTLHHRLKNYSPGITVLMI